VYPITILPKSGQDLMMYNPLAPILGATQNVLVQGLWPNWIDLIYSAVLGLTLCVFGWRLFKKRSGEMVDEL
jgi:lipopolysaccharide transport system permease protein